MVGAGVELVVIRGDVGGAGVELVVGPDVVVVVVRGSGVVLVGAAVVAIGIQPEVAPSMVKE